MTERWLPVVGWEGLYEVSDHGRVRSLDRVLEQTAFDGSTYRRRFRGKMLKYKFCAKGPYGRWCTVCLGRGVEGQKYVLVGRTVLTAFAGECPRDMEAAHNNGNPEDNRIGNLRWDTHVNNQQDIVKHGRQRRPDPHITAVKAARKSRLANARAVSLEIAQEIRRAVAAGATLVSQAERFGYAISKNGTAHTVSAIVHGRVWASA